MKIFYVLLIILINASSLFSQQLKYEKEQARPLYWSGKSSFVDNLKNYHPAYRKLDTMLVIITNLIENRQQNIPWYRTAPAAIKKEFAKTILWTKSINEKYDNYFTEADAAANEQNKRQNEGRKSGYNNFSEKRIVKPRGLVGRFSLDYIFNEYDWDWEFYIRNRYILVVEPIKSETLPIEPGLDLYSTYYTCKIINDLKDNFEYPENSLVKFSASFARTSMDMNKQYLVLVWGKNNVTEYHGEHYLLRGNATENKAIFPIENGDVIDDKELLRQNKIRFKVSDYKETIHKFINSNIED